MSGQGETSWRGRLKGQAVGRAKALPLKSITRIAVVVVLAGSAAFGGLADAAEPPIAERELGQPHHGSPLTITVQGVSVVDVLPGNSAAPEPGQSFLRVRAELVNEWDEPLLRPLDAVRVSGVDGLDATAEAEMVLYAADGDELLRLQPGVPTVVDLVWSVRTAAATPGSPVTVELFDLSLYTFTAVAVGQEWSDPTLAVTMPAVIETAAD
ncbi:hypothetical protein ASC66_06420 [Leifsonia sp. Root4]|uniref:hypothetical protein n=1 Tax=Leifsonia sp. Root4 TaxID=1736525 RepID=UPI0006FE97A2|nr:hypothetical protein [Leifsonia sp. Root4]KQW06166.1 hypothetical protein ASC66_06420 [Leifsonia sp. Root4]